MNNCQLVGRLTRDPDIRYTDGGSTIARFTVAVDRAYGKNGERSADFIPCVSFGKTAEFIEKYFSKGQRIGLAGRIQTGSYTNKDGAKVYTTDVVAERVEFVESKGRSAQEQAGEGVPSSDEDGFMQIPDGFQEELPF